MQMVHKCRHSVKNAIQTHSFRQGWEPTTIEAKTLFDADKLDAVGTMGIARTLIYQGLLAQPLYLMDDQLQADVHTDAPSFLHEYERKLSKLYDRFYTAEATEIAGTRKAAAENFVGSFIDEVQYAHEDWAQLLSKLLTQ